MKSIFAVVFITLLAIGNGCVWISQSGETTDNVIKVHGQWTVTITNPDGTLETKHNFDNDITYLGNRILIGLLAGETAVIKGQTPELNGWSIRLIEDSSSNENVSCKEYPVLYYPVIPDPIVVSENTDLMLNDSFPSLLRLSGTCTIELGQLTGVSLTGVKTNVSLGGIKAEFTEASLDPIPLLQGQLVSFNVEISFQ